MDMAWIEGGALLLNALVLPAVGIWKLTRVEVALRGAIAASREETDNRIESNARAVGETIAAIREKVREVELFCRDTFMRRDSFVQVQASMEGSIRELGADLKSWLERLEKKIDTKT